MKRCSMVLMMSLLLAGGRMAAAAGAEETTKGWHTNYERAAAEAKAHNLPLLIHFYADWCGPCRQMESTVLNSSEVRAQLGTRVVGVKINTDSRQDLVSRFGIAGLPSDVIVSPEGKTLTRRSGAMARGAYVAQMQRYGSSLQLEDGNQLAKAAPDKKASGPIAAAAASLSTALKEGSIASVGLEGFCPVSITADRVWEKGKPEYSWQYQGVTYYMASAVELRMFQADPERFAPRYLGCDPLELTGRNEAVAGSIHYGAFYRGKLFLMSSDANRRQFIATPHRYSAYVRVADLGDEADLADDVDLEDLR